MVFKHHNGKTTNKIRKNPVIFCVIQKIFYNEPLYNFIPY